MSMRKVRKDVHGLYVKFDGSIYRPQMNEFYRGITVPIMVDGCLVTHYGEGENVIVHGLRDLLYIQINEEYWYLHGSCEVFDDHTTSFIKRASEECWQG